MVFLCVNEAIYNPDSEYSLLSVFQIRQFKVKLDTTPTVHGGLQQMLVDDGVEVPLKLKRRMVYFSNREPDSNELQIMQQDKSLVIHITRGGKTWESHRFNDDPSQEFLSDVIEHAHDDNEDEDNVCQSALMYYDPLDNITHH